MWCLLLIHGNSIYTYAGIILCMRPANERRRYIVTSSLIGWAHTQNDPCIWYAYIVQGPYSASHVQHAESDKVARAPSQYPKRRLSVTSRKVSKPRDLYLELSDRSEIWQALRQQCCRCACKISRRHNNLKYQSRGFETLRDLTKRRLFEYWDGALMAVLLEVSLEQLIHFTQLLEALVIQIFIRERLPYHLHNTRWQHNTYSSAHSSTLVGPVDKLTVWCQSVLPVEKL